MNDPAVVEAVLAMRTWAVVGMTDVPYKASCFVPEYLLAHGYDVVPVNPAYEEILGRRCHPDLASLPEPPDVVDLFRRADVVGVHVDEAIDVGARAVWLQSGIVDDAAAERARRAGLLVVMDTCPKVEIPRRRVRHPTRA
jgi:predicted CoA-binding protein